MPTQGDYTGDINWNRNANSKLAVNPKQSSAPGVVQPTAPKHTIATKAPGALAPHSASNPKIAARAAGVAGKIGMQVVPTDGIRAADRATPTPPQVFGGGEQGSGAALAAGFTKGNLFSY